MKIFALATGIKGVSHDLAYSVSNGGVADLTVGLVRRSLTINKNRASFVHLREFKQKRNGVDPQWAAVDRLVTFVNEKCSLTQR